MKPTKEFANRLAEALEGCASGIYGIRSYSGRGMYGDTCLAVNVDRGFSAFSLGVQLAVFLDEDDEHREHDRVELVELEVREDSMGRGGVVYFPGITWDAKWGDEEESEDNQDE